MIIIIIIIITIITINHFIHPWFLKANIFPVFIMEEFFYFLNCLVVIQLLSVLSCVVDHDSRLRNLDLFRLTPEELLHYALVLLL